MHIRLQWNLAAPKRGGLRVLEQGSWFDPGMLSPLAHVRRGTWDGAAVVKGYRFLLDSAVGLAGPPGNAADGSGMPFSEPVFNFECGLRRRR